MSKIVTQMKSAKTTSTPLTISDCATSTIFVPTRLTPTITRISTVMKRWSR